MLLGELAKSNRIYNVLIRDTVGNEDHAGGPVVIEIFQGQAQPVVDVGAPVGLDLLNALNRFLRIFGSGFSQTPVRSWALLEKITTRNRS